MLCCMTHKPIFKFHSYIYNHAFLYHHHSFISISNNIPGLHCTTKSIVWFRHSSSSVKSNLHDSWKEVTSEGHDKLVMTWYDELVKFSLGGKKYPPVEE